MCLWITNKGNPKYSHKGLLMENIKTATHRIVQAFGTMYFKNINNNWFWFNKETQQYEPTKLLDKPKIKEMLIKI